MAPEKPEVPRQLRTWLSGFDPLDAFGDGSCPWEVKAVGTAVVFGPKRYVICDEAGQVVAFTEHVIGAYVPPPGTTGRDEDGQHLWARQTVQVLAHARISGQSLTPTFPWEAAAPDFPALRRYSLSGPDAVSNMPPALGLRAFSRIVQGIAVFRDVNVVAPDPGGDLADWRDLNWHDARTGQPISVTTDPGEIGSVLLDTLRARAVAWARPSARDLPESVRLDPLRLPTRGEGRRRLPRRESPGRTPGRRRGRGPFRSCGPAGHLCLRRGDRDRTSHGAAPREGYSSAAFHRGQSPSRPRRQSRRRRAAAAPRTRRRQANLPVARL